MKYTLIAALAWSLSLATAFAQEAPTVMNCKKWKTYERMIPVEGTSAAHVFWLSGYYDGLAIMAIRASVLMSTGAEKGFEMLVSVKPEKLSIGAVIAEVNVRCEKLPEEMPVPRIIADIALGK